jgi:hypothetical protein
MRVRGIRLVGLVTGLAMGLAIGLAAVLVSGPPSSISDDCGYSPRGLPHCGAVLGAAYGSNTDPTAWERRMGRSLGVHRTYFAATDVAEAVATVEQDLAAQRIPWISFKLPHSWAEMADGKGDVWARDLATRLAASEGAVWVAFHHEPEGDGDIAEWTRMQTRLAPLVRALAPNVAYSIILTGWNQFHGPAEYRLDSLMPNTKVDLLGLDVYDEFGVNGNREHTPMKKEYFTKVHAWTKAHAMAWGLAETGFTDESAADDPRWVEQTFADLVATHGVALTYFNTDVNAVASWKLSGAKEDAFAKALRSTPML